MKFIITKKGDIPSLKTKGKLPDGKRKQWHGSKETVITLHQMKMAMSS